MIITKSELEAKVSEIEQKERFVVSVKTTNKEMQAQLKQRNDEFVEWKKGVAAQIYKDWDNRKHIENEVEKIESRYETSLNIMRVSIQELSTENSRLKQEKDQYSRKKVNEMNRESELQAHIEVLKKAT